MHPLLSGSDPDTQKIDGRKRNNGEGSEAPRLPFQPDTDTLIAISFLLGSATVLGVSSVYRRFFKRIKGAEWITPDLVERKRWITGVVTRVGDADNFRLYHTPGFGWRGPFKFRHLPSNQKELYKSTIHIRIAAVDAPEGPHFGNPQQPLYFESLAWLKDRVEGRRIKCQLLRRDQYKRVVALPLLPRRGWMWSKRVGATRNLPLEMIREGWGVVYTKAGAEYGDWDQETYLAAQAEAQAARRGIWHGGTDIETPAEYKKRMRMGERKVEEDVEPEDQEPEVEKVGFWSRIFGRRKRDGDKTSL